MRSISSGVNPAQLDALVRLGPGVAQGEPRGPEHEHALVAEAGSGVEERDLLDVRGPHAGLFLASSRRAPFSGVSPSSNRPAGSSHSSSSTA